MSDLWSPFRTNIMAAIDSVPGDVTISAGFLSNSDHTKMFNALKGDPSSQNLLGNRRDTLFTQGKGAILKFQDAATERAFNKNASYYGLEVEGAFVHPVGERQRGVRGKNRQPNRDELFALMSNFRHYTPDPSPYGKNAQTLDHSQHEIDADLRTLLEEHEGIEYETYLDTEGNLTGGIGHLLTDETGWELGDSISADQVEAWFEEDLETHAAGAMHLERWDEFPTELKNALVSFAFNVGPNAFGLSGDAAWPKMTAALNEGRWADARQEVFEDWDNVQVSRLEHLLNALDAFIDSETNKSEGT